MNCFYKWVRGATAIVTGGNAGIGEATSRRLRLMGVNVVIASRDTEKGQKCVESIMKDQGNPSGCGTVEFQSLDLSDFESIRSFADAFKSRHATLEILVNNAGTAMRGTHKAEKTGYSVTFMTNYLGHFYLTDLLKPLLVKAKQARIVNLSSVMHRKGKMDFEKSLLALSEHCYADTKLAMALYTQELQRRLTAEGHHHIKAVAANPGGVNSTIWRRFSCVYKALFSLILLSTDQGCESSLFGATSPEVNGGEYVSVYMVPSTGTLLDSACDTYGLYCGHCVAPFASSCTPELGKELWEHSFEWIKRKL